MTGNRFWNTAKPIGLYFLIAFALFTTLQFKLPSPEGPYPVGQAIFRWLDPSRPEVLTQDPDDVRELMALVWYPAEPGTGLSAGYFPHLSTVSRTLAKSGEVEWWQIFGLPLVRTSIPMDANPLKEQAPFPVVLLSPGNGTNVEFYASLASEIASHGYVVVGLNHPYDVAAVQLTDGNVASFYKDQWLRDLSAQQTFSAERIKVRTADVLFALDQLKRINSDTNSPFDGILDLHAIAVMGHSLGGITASEACKADRRFKACLNFDGLQKGGPFSTEETAIPPEQPFLFMTKETQFHPKLIEAFESTSEAYWIVIPEASHDSFTDGPLLEPFFLPGARQADRTMDLIQSYTLAFLDQNLKGQPSNLLLATIDRADVLVKVFLN